MIDLLAGLSLPDALIAADPVEKVLSHLPTARQTGPHQWEANCPAHQDNRASLRIGRGDDGRALVKCMANCPTPAVLHSLGMTVSELYSKPPKSRKRIVAQYAYRDEAGTLLYESVRYEPKTFKQRVPKPEGGYEWKLNGARRVLYRLPELLAADPCEPVFIAEGEKDVENLAHRGCVATCNVGGAGKWRPEYSDNLAGRHVILLPDNDDPGRQHIDQVGAALQGTAASVRIVSLPGLPPKGDVSDWLAAGGTADELRRMAADAPAWEPAAKPPSHESTQLVVANSTGDDESREPLAMPQIIERVKSVCGDWPRRVGNALFVHERQSDIDWLPNPAALLGFIGARSAIPPKFTNGPGYHTKPELFEELRRTAQAYDAVAAFPHEPPMPGHYYACNMPEPGDGETLRELIGRFNPETDIDGDLILAFIATTLWGGPGGSRPAFGITSDDGRGVGKTTLVQMIGRLFGGTLEFSADEDPEEIKKRLLSPEGLTKRVALLDNIKRSRFSSAEIESLITAPTISGKRMYVGEGSRPNTLVWAVTMNGGSYSTDLAQRTVFIKLRRPAHSGGWSEQTAGFIDANADRIISDLVGLLRGERFELQRYSRWGAWERDVLSRLPDPSEAQRVILERQGVADVEVEECDLIEEFFRQQLREATYDTDREIIHIPSSVACNWLSRALNEQFSTTSATRTINQRIGEGKLPRIRASKSRAAAGRGFLWWGEDVCDSHIRHDIEQRIEETKKQREIETFREKREAARGF